MAVATDCDLSVSEDGCQAEMLLVVSLKEFVVIRIDGELRHVVA
jgi:hypothetical protein